MGPLRFFLLEKNIFKNIHIAVIQRCEGSARIFGVGISAFDPSLPGITNRTEDCTLETIGKPVFKRFHISPLPSLSFRGFRDLKLALILLAVKVRTKQYPSSII